jgi:hypothetical protein
MKGASLPPPPALLRESAIIPPEVVVDTCHLRQEETTRGRLERHAAVEQP